MDREELLKAAKESAPKLGEAEKENGRKALIIAMCVMTILLTAKIVAEILIKRTVDCGTLSIFLSFLSVWNTIEGIKTNKKRLIVGGVFAGIGAVITLIIYIRTIFV
ncbi:MAG: DUF6442 family protein [Lachnospiraceae bacterium]|nr:DUF6442 family protein [Lachnospiraceae bacterium]